MSDFNYQAEAQLTRSSSFHGDKVKFYELLAVVMNTVKQLQQLDKIKKTLFYGKVNAELMPVGEDLACTALPQLINVDIIHSIIGKATEAGELLEAFYRAMMKFETFDTVNFREEIGDGMWYDAIGLNAINDTIENCQQINIAKLRARFPNKFTEYDANNRDLTNERCILEG